MLSRNVEPPLSISVNTCFDFRAREADFYTHIIPDEMNLMSLGRKTSKFIEIL